MIVVDAVAWVRALVDSGPSGDASREVLRDDPDWAAPAHAPIEVLRTIRRFEQAELISSAQADAYAEEVRHAEVRYAGPDPWLLSAVWERRHNVSPYDAPYIAVAQRYGVSMVTFDERLARTSRALGVDVVVPSPSA